MIGSIEWPGSIQATFPRTAARSAASPPAVACDSDHLARQVADRSDGRVIGREQRQIPPEAAFPGSKPLISGVLGCRGWGPLRKPSYRLVGFRHWAGRRSRLPDGGPVRRKPGARLAASPSLSRRGPRIESVAAPTAAIRYPDPLVTARKTRDVSPKVARGLSVAAPRRRNILFLGALPPMTLLNDAECPAVPAA